MKKSLLLVLFLLACPLWAVPIRIITTADMHGYLLPRRQDGYTVGGAAEMLAYWKKYEGYRPDRFLTISCGDIWDNGPLLSPLLKGEPTIDAMNLMGYDACAVGNHETGAINPQTWRQLAKFPFISANLLKDGKPWENVQPYVILEQNGIKIGIIGLTVADKLDVYLDALRKYVPEVRAKGAQVLIIAAHVPEEDLLKLITEMKDPNLPLWLAGHYHELGAKEWEYGAWVVSSGDWFGSYSRVDLDYNPKTGRCRVAGARQVNITSTEPLADKVLAERLKMWEKQLAQLSTNTPRVEVPWLVKPPVIDGKLDPGEWPVASLLESFWVPAQDRQSEPPTRAWIGIDAQYLYLAAQCTLVPGVKPTVNSTERDTKQWDDDSIELFIWPDESRERFVQFIVNAAGSLFDCDNVFGRAISPTSDLAWNPIYTAKATIGQDAWVLEMAIPLPETGIDARPGKSFRLNITRNIIGGPQRFATWSPLPLRNFHVPPFFGKAVIGPKL